MFGIALAPEAQAIAAMLVDADSHEAPDEDLEATQVQRLTADVYRDRACVEDVIGGVWWAGDEALARILAAADPEAEAIRIAAEEPMRGTWES